MQSLLLHVSHSSEQLWHPLLSSYVVGMHEQLPSLFFWVKFELHVVQLDELEQSLQWAPQASHPVPESKCPESQPQLNPPIGWL